MKNEGVGILLNIGATVAWKDAGESWEAIYQFSGGDVANLDLEVSGVELI